MNRRRLILTTLGALAGCLGLPKVALASAEPIAALVSKPKVPIAELYISVSQEVNEALSRETTVVSKQPPLITIGSLIVSNEAEAEAFLQRMAEVIRAAARR